MILDKPRIDRILLVFIETLKKDAEIEDKLSQFDLYRYNFDAEVDFGDYGRW